MSYLNLVTFFIAVSFGSIALLVYADSVIGFVLSNVVALTPDQLASEAFKIVFFGELVVFATIWLAGMLSDRVGRRWVFFGGTVLIAGSFCAMPFAQTVWQVLLFRLLMAPGAAAVSAMLMALICDYPRDDTHARSRGKASGIMGALSGLGALFALFVLTRVASWVQPSTTGGPPLLADSTAGKVQFFVAAGVALVCGIVSLLGLAKRQGSATYEHAAPQELIMSGLRGLRDGNVVLAYMASFVARGDSTLITLSLPLWTAAFAALDPTNNLADARNRGYEIGGIIQTIALCSAPIIGVLADRFSRVGVTLFSGVFSMVGFLLLGLINNPFEWTWQLCAAIVLLGVGEMGVLITGLSIMGLHAPTTTRGSISGFWSLCGSAGILCGSGFGSLLSSVAPGGPFLLFAGFNAVLSVYALVLYLVQRAKARAQAVAETQALIQG